MAPLTFPNEKQMVSGEGSGPAAGWSWRGARWGAGRGGFWGHAGVFCSVLKTGERGKKTTQKQMRLFHGWALFFLLFSFDGGGGEEGAEVAFPCSPPTRARPPLSGHCGAMQGEAGRCGEMPTAPPGGPDVNRPPDGSWGFLPTPFPIPFPLRFGG